MRLSALFGKTLRQPPSEARLVSHQLLVRAAYVRGVGLGQFAYLPLGSRTLHRLQALVKERLSGLGAQELALPDSPDVEPAQALVRIVSREVDSYRQLPTVLYRLAPHRDSQLRGSAGLFGATESPIAEIQVFDAAGMAVIGEQLDAALADLFAACNLEVVWAEAGDTGRRAYFSHPSGDEELVRCPGCGYAAERSWAAVKWPDPPDDPELPTEEVETPGCDTIASLAEFLGISAAQTLKMVFYSVAGRVTCVVIRGDRAVDEGKLARVLGTDQYYASVEDELAAVGAVGGYASPIGLDPRRLRVVADPSVSSARNSVSGANRPDYHIRNVNVPRDFEPGEWADLALVEPGDACPECGALLDIESAFSLAYATAPAPCQPDAEYLDPEGRAHALWRASWSVDLGRLMAAVVESHNDEYGIIWPPNCAPFDVHLVALDLGKEEAAAQAEQLYASLQAAGLRLLYDDRPASAGVKFNDADLIGIPLRLTVSKRSVRDGIIEAKWRSSSERLKLDDDGLAAEIARLG
ncbi:MAG: proline--tRNA ligase [Anaerolineae bacterium]